MIDFGKNLSMVLKDQVVGLGQFKSLLINKVCFINCSTIPNHESRWSRDQTRLHHVSSRLTIWLNRQHLLSIMGVAFCFLHLKTDCQNLLCIDVDCYQLIRLVANFIRCWVVSFSTGIILLLMALAICFGPNTPKCILYMGISIYYTNCCY